MTPFLRTKDYSNTQEPFELLYDERFDMLVTKPRPANLDPYYDSAAYISHTDANSSLIDKLYQRVKSYSLQKKVSLINSYAKKERHCWISEPVRAIF